MECEETVTMVLPKGTDISGWKANPEVSIKTPDFDQLEQHELKYYGPLYGKISPCGTTGISGKN